MSTKTQKPSRLAQIERRKTEYASPAFAPAVKSDRRKPPQFSPERVRELMAEQEAIAAAKKAEKDAQSALVAARHAEVQAAREWHDPSEVRRANARPSDRRLHTYSREQQRVLEVRYYHAKKIHQKKDSQISAELDLSQDDFPELAGLAGRL